MAVKWGEGEPYFLPDLETTGLSYWGEGSPLSVIYIPTPSNPDAAISITACEAIAAKPDNVSSLSIIEDITMPVLGTCRSLTISQGLLFNNPVKCASKTSCSSIILDAGDFFLPL